MIKDNNKKELDFLKLHVEQLKHHVSKNKHDFSALRSLIKINQKIRKIIKRTTTK